MTEVMNFFQSMFVFNNFTLGSASKEDLKLAKSLKCEARKLAGRADEEMRNGRTTQALAFEATDKEKTRIFAEIAIWHNGRAAAKYRQSAERFAEAGKIQTAKSRTFNLNAKEMRQLAIQAESAVELLNDFLSQN